MTEQRRKVVTVSDTRAALHALYRSDGETSAKHSLLRLFADELVPVDSRGKWKPGKLFVIPLGILVSAACVFAYFSFR